METVMKKHINNNTNGKKGTQENKHSHIVLLFKEIAYHEKGKFLVYYNLLKLCVSTLHTVMYQKKKSTMEKVYNS